MEILSLLTTAKEAGFEFGSMITLAVIYFRLSRKMDDKWEKLIHVVAEHNNKNEERFNKIETTIGLSKGE